jgi:hypothetical protein
MACDLLKPERMRDLICLCAVLMTAAGAAGCGGDESDEPAGRGSAACQDFQDATCDFAADRCKRIDRSICDQGFRGIECTSDDLASSCANALNAAVCGQPVAACPIQQLVDPQPAIARCNTLLDRLCGHLTTCGAATSVEACRMQANTMLGIDCAQALSASLNYEPCLEALEGLACTAQIPSVCRGVIGILPAAG